MKLTSLCLFALLLSPAPSWAQPTGLDKFTGAYKATSVTIFHVRPDGDHLLAQLSGGPQMTLSPAAPSHFTDPMSNAEFVFSDDGEELTASRDTHVFHAKRISDEAAKALEDAVSVRFKADVPASGTEESVRRYIVSLEKGAPNYDEMEPRVAEDVRMSLPAELTTIHRLGALKSLTFTVVTSNGMDVYDAAFEHGHVMVGLAPLDADGKVEFRSWSPRN